ncbi:hypothetical protein [Xanthocytophaga agilis]|uniref:Uncharacterized protein n=1 Tax=Xanthocytophaga agilis TaxID=3048010 RepID=A0AAE3R7Y8_9BACT|nr:hypothetical protein [Xanthocytophaga agilis]MDJ1505526.1 hypothetical protein [Xanthocytophaga agilis]
MKIPKPLPNGIFIILTQLFADSSFESSFSKPNWNEYLFYATLFDAHTWIKDACTFDDYTYPIDKLERLAFDPRAPHDPAEWLQSLLIEYRDNPNRDQLLKQAIEERLSVDFQERLDIWRNLHSDESLVNDTSKGEGECLG